MTDTSGLCQRSWLCRKGTFLCGKAILVCGYGVYFATKEVYFATQEFTSSRRNITDRQKEVSLATAKHLRVLLSLNGDPDAQVEITTSNVRTFEGGEMSAADFTDERGWAQENRSRKYGNASLAR